MPRNGDIQLAYGLWAERIVREGWSPYLLTFMFRPLGGSPIGVARQMEREVERVYATMLTRIIRNPTRPSMVGRLPIFFCAHDRPVYKRAKITRSDAVINHGRHCHAVAFLPPWSRLEGCLVDHLEDHQSLYVRPEFPLDRFDAVRITQNTGYVVGYARKQVGRDLVGEDADFVLPRSFAEIPERAA